jgi:clan AA aspartic protease (TIGR02281 family)
MRPVEMFALSLVFGGVVFAGAEATARSALNDIVAEETHRAEGDLAIGGMRKLSAVWYSCLEQARASQDANTAERCVIYGYGALRLADARADAGSLGMRHLTADSVEPAQSEMLDIMGIPSSARQAWLDRYRNAVAKIPPTEAGSPDPVSRDPLPPLVSPGAARPAEPARWGEDTTGDPHADLARAAGGKYPAEALRDPAIGAAVRRLIGPSVFARMRDLRFGGAMEFNGRYAVGTACDTPACEANVARLVLSADEAWLALINNGRTQVYGNPPRPVVRLLVPRDRDPVAWRGPIEEPRHPLAPEPMPGTLERPRLTISPRVLPVSAESAPRPASDVTEIPLRRARGELVVPVVVNDALTVPFAVDSGASDVSISADVMRRLIESGTLTRADFLGKATYHLADGSRVASDTFRLHSLRVGDREVHGVLASVTNDSEGLLLGQSFLTRFRSWSIDNQRQVLLLR